jgi:hypothetical protein
LSKLLFLAFSYDRLSLSLLAFPFSFCFSFLSVLAFATKLLAAGVGICGSLLLMEIEGAGWQAGGTNTRWTFLY